MAEEMSIRTPIGLAPDAGDVAEALTHERPATDLSLARTRMALPSPAWSAEVVHRKLLVFGDVGGAVAAIALSLDRLPRGNEMLVALLGVPLLVLLFKMTGLYDHDELRLANSTLDEAPALLQLTGLGSLGIGIIGSVLQGHEVSWGEAALLWLTSFLAILGIRIVARSLSRRILPLERCLVIGDLPLASRVQEKIAAGRAHADIVACMPLGAADIADTGTLEAIRREVGDLRVHRVIVASRTVGADGVAELVRMAKDVGVSVSVLPRILEVVGAGGEFDEIEGMTMLAVPGLGLSRSSRLIKRAFDVIVTAAGLALISPLIALIALAIRLDSRGPIFFRQVRVGQDGEHFSIVKFRSMVPDADACRRELRTRHGAGDGLFKLQDDPRVTRVGAILRRTSLDELPQLFNVLRGEMSLVGPRPLVVDEDAQVEGLYRNRLRLTPGMTGPWQLLHARVPLEEMVEIDYRYVANWSLWLDVKILLLTVVHVLRAGNM
jgi:exopolysaccharide biosynthesis polyprenyl glycosylphosphotransferase